MCQSTVYFSTVFPIYLVNIFFFIYETLFERTEQMYLMFVGVKPLKLINTSVLIPQNSNYIENLSIFKFGIIFLFLEGGWVAC